MERRSGWTVETRSTSPFSMAMGFRRMPADSSIIRDMRPPTANSPYPPTSETTVDIIFIDPLDPSLACPLCEQALRHPVRSPCGHLFCEQCLKGETTRCPVCQASIPVENCKPDKTVARQIQALRVKCSYADNGCMWQGKLVELQEHAMGCEWRDMVCQRGCGQTYCRKNEEQHRDECSKSTAMCEFCKQSVSKKGMEMHKKICLEAVIECPNKCGITGLPRKQMMDHLPNCELAGNECPFSEFGCVFGGGREVLQQHIKDEPIRHLTYLCDGVIELKTLLAHMQLNMENLLRDMEVLQEKNANLERIYGAQCVWRIENVMQKQNEARSGAKNTVFSAPFMSNRHGYKLVLSACLFGNGPVRGQYFSCYVTIMKGDFDAILPWPFLHKVTFTLIDQKSPLGERNDVVYEVQPVPGKNSSSYLDRPVSGRNAAFGAERMCQLDHMHQFIHDDCLFLKVHIDPQRMDAV